ncbi:hypothetical protein LAD77_01575 [Klebsiella pneumoniae]|nr:hypothetical protein [Klebsiella pneumoniae]
MKLIAQEMEGLRQKLEDQPAGEVIFALLRQASPRRSEWDMGGCRGSAVASLMA